MSSSRHKHSETPMRRRSTSGSSAPSSLSHRPAVGPYTQHIPLSTVCASKQQSLREAVAAATFATAHAVTAAAGKSKVLQLDRTTRVQILRTATVFILISQRGHRCHTRADC